jgi:hypothetical protein
MGRPPDRLASEQQGVGDRLDRRAQRAVRVHLLETRSLASTSMNCGAKMTRTLAEVASTSRNRSNALGPLLAAIAPES